jgi:putative SOS response-associated peptidase YedK
MCNRFRSLREWSEIPRDLARGARFNFEFNPNVAPTELVPILVAQRDGPPAAVLARFGIAQQGRDGRPRSPLLNARTDGLRRGQFRTHLQERRCVIPAQGFYEWRDEAGKQPYYFSRRDGAALMLAGIWQEAEYKGDRRIAFAILTEAPNALVAPYHDRMPLALADEKVPVWLDLGRDDALAGDVSLDLAAFEVRPMSRAMNTPRQKDLALIDPVFAR